MAKNTSTAHAPDTSRVWQPVHSFIREHDSFVISSHVYPDGDAVGSQLGLAGVLRQLGKRVLVADDHPVPQVFRFLDRRGTVKVFDAGVARRIARADAALIVDVTELDRLGAVGKAIRDAGLPTACIDHHKTNAGEADVSVVRRDVASTGELIHSLAKSLGISLTPGMARALFVAVSTDTGWFRYSNTRADTLRAAAELVNAGARPDAIYAAVYESAGWQRMRLRQLVMQTVASAADGRIAWFYATEEMFREAGATHEDCERFTDIPRELGDVQVILFFREVDGQVKVSIRSKGPAVDGLARKYGGGGHALAAGATVEGELRAIMEKVLADAADLVSAVE
jgi:phosphoesterase RecJ-like protein